MSKGPLLMRVCPTVIFYQIYNDEVYYLVLQRGATTHFPGKWTVPGGGIESKDYEKLKPDYQEKQWYGVIEQSLRREIEEETGIEYEDDFSLITNLVFLMKGDIPCLVLSFAAPLDKGTTVLVDGKENVDYDWVTLERARFVDLIPGIIHEIEMVEKLIQDGEL